MAANSPIEPKGLAYSAGVGVIAAAIVNRFCALVLQSQDVISGIEYASQNLFRIFSTGLVFTADTFCLMLSFIAFLLCLEVYVLYFSRGNFRRGEEHGSAKWATKKEMAAFGDPKVPINNTLLSRDVRLRYNRKGAQFEYIRNRNVLVIGGSGSGKTRGYVKPNLMQIASAENGSSVTPSVSLEEQAAFARSFVVTDPKGTTRVETGHLLATHGYEIKELNTIDFGSSMHFNPIKYIKNEEDVLSFATCLINNTTPSGSSSNDPFWEKSETLFYQALINYMLTEVPEEDRNLVTLCNLMDLAQVDEGSTAMSGLDILFAELETGKDFVAPTGNKHVSADTSLRAGTIALDNPWKSRGRKPQPNHPAVLAYNSFKSGAAKTLQSILISCKVRLAPLRSERVEEILVSDDMELDMFGDKPMALFLVLSANDSTFNFLHAILLWQMFNALMVRGTKEYGDQGGSLPIGVDFFLDEFANFYIPDFEKTIAVLRSYNIGAHVILQSKAQLKNRYEDAADIIVDCCDSLVFLGGKSQETTKELEEMMGQETVSTDNQTADHKSGSGGWSEQQGQHGRALMQASEIGKLPMTQSLVLINGANPYKGEKTDITSLPMYSWVDPGHKGAKFARGFDFAAYKTNRRYFEQGDARLSVHIERRIYTNYPFTIHPPRFQVISVLETLVIENVSEVIAFNVGGAIHFEARCKSNEDALAKNGSYAFPSMEPFGTLDGLSFTRSETRSNRKEMATSSFATQRDFIEWHDADGKYQLYGIDLAPNQSIRYSCAMSCPTTDIVSAIRKRRYSSYMADPSEDTFCEFLFDFAAKVTCANCDTITVTDPSILTVNDTGFSTCRDASWFLTDAFSDPSKNAEWLLGDSVSNPNEA